jgi:hypothetical protein
MVGVVWCDVVYSGAVWRGVVWCGVVWCGVVGVGVGVAWCGVVWCGVAWCTVVWCGVVWRGVYSMERDRMGSEGIRHLQGHEYEGCLVEGRIQSRVEECDSDYHCLDDGGAKVRLQSCGVSFAEADGAMEYDV